MAYCNNCGAKLPDGAKFCQECGSPVSGAGRQLSMPKTGKIKVFRQKDFNTGAFECTVTVDNEEPRRIINGGTISIDTTAGEHKIIIRSESKVVQRYKVTVPDNGEELVSFSLGDKVPSPTTQANAPTSSGGSGIRCPKCGGEVSFQTVTESSGLGCGSFIGVILFALLACLLSWVIGIIIFVIGLILVTKGSNETVTYAVCQRCGHRFRK